MGGGMSRIAKRELLAKIRDRYLASSKKDKSRILDEFIAVTGHHRKYGIRLLRQSDDSGDKPPTVKGRRIYDESAREAVITIWEAANRICGKRLKAALPHLVEFMERHGHLDLDSQVRARLLSASAATLDRLLKPIRPTAGSRRRRRRRQSMGKRIPVRTYNDWNGPPPGYLEIDLVAHCGGPLSGSFIHSLVVTDVCTGWTEAVPLLAGEQSLVVAELEAIIGSHRWTVAFPHPRHRVGQRHRVHQRDIGPALRRPQHRVHPCPGVPQQRPGLYRAEERLRGTPFRGS